MTGSVTDAGKRKPQRSTQTFVGTLSSTWSRPSLTGLEVAWRWLFGVPALWLIWGKLQGVIAAATGGTMDPARLGLDKALLNDPVGALTADPMGAAGKLTGAVGLVLPGLLHVAVWVAPILVISWVIISSLGRTLVLRRADRTLRAMLATMMALQAIRIAVLCGLCAVWFRCMAWCSAVTVSGPIGRGTEPNLVGFCALVIVISLGMFIGWNAVSWWFSIAPLLAMRSGSGALASLREAGRMRGAKGELVEINLVLGIVKIALLVLAMVFSACPLPFETVTTPGFLACWWAGVMVVYLLGSDFFHVARLVSYLAVTRTEAFKK